MSAADALPAGSGILQEEVAAGLDQRTRELLSARRGSGAAARRRGWIVRRALLVADLVGLTFAYALADALSGQGSIDAQMEALAFAATLPLWVLAAKLYGLYDSDEERADPSTIDDLVGVFHLLTVGTWVLVAGTWFLGARGADVAKPAFFWAVAIAAVTAGRAVARGYCRRQLAYFQNTIIVGAGDVGQLIARKIAHHPEYGLNLVGFVDEQPRERRSDLASLNLLGPPQRLPSLVRQLDVERVVVAFSREPHARTLALIRQLGKLGVRVDVVPRMFEVVGPSIGFHSVEGVPLLALPPIRLSRSSRLVKRLFDIVLAAAALAVLGVPMLVLALIVRRDSPGPVLFRQTRLGQGMRPFSMLKFRTMAVETDEAEHRAYIASIMRSDASAGSNGLYKLERAAHVTRSGRWLRRLSLDELPQLLNVLRGDMSLVGPRPCLVYETEHFEEHHFERFAVPAGITGLWQVTARAHSTFAEALEMDVAYVRSWSLSLDVSLILRTLRQFVTGRATT